MLRVSQGGEGSKVVGRLLYLFLGLAGLALAIYGGCAGWGDYRNVADLYDRGWNGTLSLVHEVGVTSHKGKDTRYFDGVMDGTPVRIADSKGRMEGDSLAVIYFPDALAKFDPAKKVPFYDFIYGERGESKWATYVLQVEGWRSLLMMAGLEVVWVVVGIWFLRSFFLGRSFGDD